MSTQVEFDPGALGDPVAWPRPGSGRAVGEPPFWDDQLGAWRVTAYADIDDIVRDADTFSSEFVVGPGRAAAFAPLIEQTARDPRAEIAKPYFHMSVIASDGAQHRREHGFVAKAFTPRRVTALEATIRSLCEELTDGLVGRRDVPFVREFAVPLPVQVIALGLGMPRTDFPDFKRWSDGFEGLTSTSEEPAERLDAFLTAAVEFTEYITPLIDERRRTPADDIISAIAAPNEAGERLTDDEILSMISALMLAGSETSTAAMSGTMLYLVRVPELQAQVRADHALIPSLVEEGLRLTSPTQGLFRTATADTAVGGVNIAKGEHLFLHFAAANRDEARFERPLAFRLDRPDRRHLAFSRGPHVCVGAPLARAEFRIAYETLFARTSAITLADRPDAVTATGNEITARVGELWLDLRA
jgi:cytochrome P450